MTRQQLLQQALVPPYALPRYQAEQLLLACLDIDRVQWRLYPDILVTHMLSARWQDWLKRYCDGTPLGYLQGWTEFYGLRLMVNAQVLCPRPDSEIMVDTVLALPLPKSGVCLLDLGTGSGALALAIKSQRPDWQVSATDISPAALEVARHNAACLGLTLSLHEGSWFAALPEPSSPDTSQFDLIISNPPYLADDDPHLPSLHAEPAGALVAREQGLADLQHIIGQAGSWLHPDGWLWLEHGWQQAAAVRQLLSQQGFVQVHTVKDYGGNDRISGGQWLLP